VKPEPLLPVLQGLSAGLYLCLGAGVIKSGFASVETSQISCGATCALAGFFLLFDLVLPGAKQPD
jgi:hypothetical protein